MTKRMIKIEDKIREIPLQKIVGRLVDVDAVLSLVLLEFVEAGVGVR